MTKSELFASIGEPFCEGLFEETERDPVLRYSKAYVRVWEKVKLSEYDGGMLYPCGKNCKKNLEETSAVIPSYSFSFEWNGDKLKEKSVEAYNIVRAEHDKIRWVTGPHTVGGAGFTHSFLNYKRVLEKGLKDYRNRIDNLPEGDFKDGMKILIDGIEAYRKRCVEYLRSINAPKQLIDALEKVPENPAENIYEALISWNFIYYIDNCDNIGYLDKHLLPYFKGEDIVSLLRELYCHCDVNDGFSVPLGPDYNEITIQCIKAVHNIRRPNMQLLVRPDMPDEVWKEVCASLATSCGQPALYNCDAFLDKLHELRPDIPNEDLNRICFGGCTETMIEGMSCVGSDDAGINTAIIFDEWMRKGLVKSKTYEEFYDGLCRETRRVVKETLEMVRNYRIDRAKYRSQPIRTLFVDDCLDKCLDFNNGGPRYNWSVANVAGLINVIESLVVIKELIYDKKIYTQEEFLEKLDGDDPEFRLLAEKCPKYGRDDDRCDLPGAEYAKVVYGAFDQVECYPSGNFYPVSNQFVTYADAGRAVKATPDGRKNAEPLCDSLGAIHGNDTEGPTAMLNSVAKLPLSMVIGTPVTNIRMNKNHLDKMLKPLVNGFFANGGMQLQVSCLSREEILDAMAHPEKHKNLVVRIGGYTEYFTKLSKDLQETVLKRTEY